jgi:hypothetical protein
VTSRQVYYWLSKGWITCAEYTGEANTQGKSLRWTEPEMAYVRRHRQLMEIGLTGPLAADVLSQGLRGGVVFTDSTDLPDIRVTIL